MITDNQARFLQRLSMFLGEHPEFDFQLTDRPPDRPRLSIQFPRGSRIKSRLEKDHRNFDYKLDALFNHKLQDAIETVLVFSSLFPSVTRAIASELCSMAASRERAEIERNKGPACPAGRSENGSSRSENCLTSGTGLNL